MKMAASETTTGGMRLAIILDPASPIVADVHRAPAPGRVEPIAINIQIAIAGKVWDAPPSAIAGVMAWGIMNGGVQCVVELSPSYECVHCSKVFREVQAQCQHENFCSFQRQGIHFFLDDLLLSSKCCYITVKLVYF
jgi:hypothetical protein